MLGGGPHVALRHRPTLASVGDIVAERLPKIIEEQLFELNECVVVRHYGATSHRRLHSAFKIQPAGRIEYESCGYQRANLGCTLSAISAAKFRSSAASSIC